MSERYYHGQFATLNDRLIVAIPQSEIVKAMVLYGEHETLNNVCLAVAMVSDAIDAAQTSAIE